MLSLYMCLCSMCRHFPQRPEEGAVSPETGVIEDHELGIKPGS